METGSRSGYFWLTSTGHHLDQFLASCPQAVLGKYLAITSSDSGSYVPGPAKVAAGWDARDGIAYSPRIESVDELPHERFDEWYVFNSPRDLGTLFQGNVFETSMRAGHVAPFVNFLGFSFHGPVMEEPADLLWSQLKILQPESFIADGTLLNFATRDEELFVTVCAALARP